VRARRSILSVPATTPRFHEKADGSVADMIVLDLEDSVAASAKVAARQGVVDALCRHAYEGKVRSVRVNAVDTSWCLDDVRHVVEGAGERIDTIFLPKAEGADQLNFLHHLLEQLEKRLRLPRRIGIELGIETPAGIERLDEICSASDRTVALHLGKGDLAASTRMPGLTIGEESTTYPGDLWHYARVKIVLQARLHRQQAIEGPYARFRDEAGLRSLAGQAAALGYDGKWAIHPAQLSALNEIFSPRQEEFDRACAIVRAYAAATGEEATGAVDIGGEMVDEATRKMAEVMVDRGRTAGMRESGVDAALFSAEEAAPAAPPCPSARR
jgi:citrate lyase subunit beta/citryl-CoA lyase